MHGTVRGGRVLGPVPVVLTEPSILLHRHWFRANGERASDPLAMQNLFLTATYFGGWGAHDELRRSGKDHQRLTLTVDVPLRLSFTVRVGQRLTDVLDSVLPPRPVL